MQKISVRFLLAGLYMASSYAYYVWLRLQHILSIRKPRSFGDTSEYFEFASRPLTSSTFWITNKPPVTSLFYRLLDLIPERIVTAQLWVSILAWGILALVIALVIQNFWLKPLAFTIVLAFSLVQNVIMWDTLLISESVALSVLALFLAASLWLLVKWEVYRFILLVVVSTLLVFVRDTYAYFLLMAAAGLLVLSFFTPKRIRVFAVSGLFVGLFFASYALAGMGMHWYTAFLMTVGLRILPNPEYVSYFESHGMPVSDLLMERAGKPIQADDRAMMEDPQLEEFREWVKQEGRSEFLKFLWFFKADTLQNPLRNADLVFNPDVFYYTATGYEPILTSMRLNELLYPTRFGLLASFAANVIAVGLLYAAFRYRCKMWILPLILVLLSYPQAVLIWNADANDIARHSVHHVIMLRLGFWILVSFVADSLWGQIQSFAKARISSLQGRKNPDEIGGPTHDAVRSDGG